MKGEEIIHGISWTQSEAGGNCRMGESDPGPRSKPGSAPETARNASQGLRKSLETACSSSSWLGARELVVL